MSPHFGGTATPASECVAGAVPSWPECLLWDWSVPLLHSDGGGQGCPSPVESGRWQRQARKDTWPVRLPLMDGRCCQAVRSAGRKSRGVFMCDDGVCTLCRPTEMKGG